MPTLLERQSDFVRALVASSHAVPAGLDAASAIGFEIYRNNLREGARKALAADYPVVERLVGPQCWRALALAYLAAHPSSAGDLRHFGDAFPEFLDRHYADGVHAYLGDVARLERALAAAQLASCETPVLFTQLAALPPATCAVVRVRLIASTARVSSRYPILDIWRANQPDADPDVPIDLAAGGHEVLVWRPADDVRLAVLTAHEARFVDALAAGAPLGAALESSVEAGADAGALLARVFALGLPGEICHDPVNHSIGGKLP